MSAAPTAYYPARRPNPAAAERAVYYADWFGSAAAALDVVDCPGHNDAFERTVCEELRVLRRIEWTAAKAEREALRVAA